MHRLLLRWAALGVVLACTAGPAFGQPAGLLLGDLSDGWSGPGFYLSWVKILACWLLFLLWVAGTDWVNRACWLHDLNALRWNPIVFGVFFGAFVVVWIVPWFFVSFPLLLLAWAVPFAAFVLHHNKHVEPQDRAFTQAHIRRTMARVLKPLGVKIEEEQVDVRDAGPPLELDGRGGATPRDDAANRLAARQAPGYNELRVLLAKALDYGVDALMLDFSQQGVEQQLLIDGVWHPEEPFERERGDPMLEALKLLCGCNPEDRQGRQRGLFTAKYQGRAFRGTMTSQGTRSGERVVVQFEREKAVFRTLDELGMRPKLQEQLKEALGATQGFVLFSAPQGQGLRTTVSVAIDAMDRFTRDFVSVEDDKNRSPRMENVAVEVYRSSEGQTPASILRDVFLKEPGVVVVRDLADARTVSMMCKEIANDRLMIATVRAKDCAEALLNVLALEVPPQELARAITAVVCQRLVRKLCEHCKEAYMPTAQQLQQLRIPPGRVEVLFRPPQQAEEPCKECHGIGYVGRTAIFELLVVNDAVREVLASNPQPGPLRQAIRQAGTLSLQEEGILLVAKGITSLAELARVFKQ